MSNFKKIGTPATIGELREAIKNFPPETSFGFRNQPMQELNEVELENQKFVVFDLPEDSYKLSWELLISAFVQFALYTFFEADQFASIRKLKKEIDELMDALVEDGDYLHEYIDCIMCLFHSAAKAGITPEELRRGFEEKLRINKGRKWIKNRDNTYSHVKSF